MAVARSSCPLCYSANTPAGTLRALRNDHGFAGAALRFPLWISPTPPGPR